MDQNASFVEDHSRVIIHIDLDCFYAQVETNKNPLLADVPLGIQQKNIVVTGNYKAREYGIKKCMLISKAQELCPNLVLVNGEDLHDYRQISYKVTSLIQQKYSTQVERLGLDENFVDVTDLVQERLKNSSNEPNLVGHLFSADSIIDLCECGCRERLTMATCLAQDIRNSLKTDLNLTSCAGIAHNKLLAKIVGSWHKPNQQTVVFPNNAVELMLSLKSCRSIPGIGITIAEQLETIGVKTVEDLQNVELRKLEQVLGTDKAKNIHNLSFGLDGSTVKCTGRPQSIGIEDSCRSISVDEEVRNKLHKLLNRLLVLVQEDGRIPKTIKLTVRKFDKKIKTGSRETRQCNINPALFHSKQPGAKEEKLMTTIMHLFGRAVDMTKPYHITLLGLSFTKFQERLNSKHSIASFLKKDIEVQSVTSIENENYSPSASFNGASTSTSWSDSSTATDASSSPSPKKPKVGHLNLITKKRCFDNFDDCESPSKLKVEDLCLNSTEDQIYCPPNADRNVFIALPRDIQKELWDEFKRKRESESNCNGHVKKTKPNTLLNYFVRRNS